MNKKIKQNSCFQKAVFLHGEGDSYFRRNRKKSRGLAHGYKIYKKFIRPGARILEIGCGTGRNLAYFNNLRKCECFGVEPSRLAVDEGKRRYPFLDLCVGASDKLNFPNAFFDFVLFGFCLYLVDRPLLKKTVAEADRVLKKGAYLGITDFDVKNPVRRPYKHHKGVYSYKMEYWRLFDAFPGYALVEKSAFSHSGDSFVEDVQERLSSVVLFKGNWV